MATTWAKPQSGEILRTSSNRRLATRTHAHTQAACAISWAGEGTAFALSSRDSSQEGMGPQLQQTMLGCQGGQGCPSWPQAVLPSTCP